MMTLHECVVSGSALRVWLLAWMFDVSFPLAVADLESTFILLLGVFYTC